jgi:hypothetical protein
MKMAIFLGRRSEKRWKIKSPLLDVGRFAKQGIKNIRLTQNETQWTHQILHPNSSHNSFFRQKAGTTGNVIHFLSIFIGNRIVFRFWKKILKENLLNVICYNFLQHHSPTVYTLYLYLHVVCQNKLKRTNFLCWGSPMAVVESLQVLCHVDRL